LAREKIVQLERQIQILEGTLENDHQTHPKEPNPAPPVISEETADYHTWYSVWHGENHSLERDCDLIVFIGQSGLSLSTEIEETMAKNKGRSSRTIRRALLECLQAGLLEQASTASIEGRPALRYTLSDKGKWLYRELAGAEAKSPDFLELLKVHKSERHLAVIQKSAEEFTRLGYRVSQEPVRLQVEENRYFEPDLVIRKGEETYYLEVETGEKAKPSLTQKWENAAAAGGRICVVTDNLATLRRIQGNIAQGSILEGRRINLFITSLVTLKEKKPWESPWYALKEYSPG
jgi:DNA-binding PadR family transcriptional regulator